MLDDVGLGVAYPDEGVKEIFLPLGRNAASLISSNLDVDWTHLRDRLSGSCTQPALDSLLTDRAKLLRLCG